MTPRIARWLVIAAAAAAVLVAAVGQEDPEPQAAEPELVLRYIYSSDAEDLLVPLIDRYNGEPHRRGGREIRIVGIDLTSGEAQAALAAGDEQAELWTPASSLWGELLNHSVAASWVPDEEIVSLVYSTQVIAMWKPLARALGWPRRPIRWSDILDLATGERTWDDYGHPEYGEFLLGHTNPGFSTSGLSAVASHYFAATGTHGALSLADVQRADVRAAVQRIESSIVHQGETAGNLIDKMLEYDVGYAHAVYVQKTTLLREPRATELAAIEPADGTFVTDYPLIVMAAPWVGPDARAAAEEFRSWLRPKITAKNAAESGFQLRRPAGLNELPRPKPEVFEAIQDAWHEDRKPANIVLVVDTSKSMGEGGRLKAARQALLSFLRELSPRDRIELITSGESITTNVPLGKVEERGPAASRAILALLPNGELPVYPAVTRALMSLRALDDPDRINAVVVLSDGAGPTEVGRNELLRTIAEEPVTEGTSVRIFTVAYGRPPDARALRQIASDSDGLFFTGGPTNINDVYRKILSYF